MFLLVKPLENIKMILNIGKNGHVDNETEVSSALGVQNCL